jgi:hypothetical protein
MARVRAALEGVDLAVKGAVIEAGAAVRRGALTGSRSSRGDEALVGWLMVES